MMNYLFTQAYRAYKGYKGYADLKARQSMDLIARTPWLSNSTAVQKLANLTSSWTGPHHDGGEDAFDGTRDAEAPDGGMGGGDGGGASVAAIKSGDDLDGTDDSTLDDEFEYDAIAERNKRILGVDPLTQTHLQTAIGLNQTKTDVNLGQLPSFAARLRGARSHVANINASEHDQLVRVRDGLGSVADDDQVPKTPFQKLAWITLNRKSFFYPVISTLCKS